MKPFLSEPLRNWLPLIVWSFLVVAPLVWIIRDWWHTSPRIAAPVWRSYFAIAAITLVGLSEILWLISGVWLIASGGGSYNPAFQWLGAVGFFAAPAGLFASLFGKGTVRWPACTISILMIGSWLVLGLSDL